MRLEPGAVAPDFAAESWDGTRVRLSDSRGRPIWLAFFRYAACPLCAVRVHDMIQRYARYRKRKLRVLAVFQSPAESVAASVGSMKPPFRVLCDPDERLYYLYGLETSMQGFLSPKNAVAYMNAASKGFMKVGPSEGPVHRLPADFLIDEDGIIRSAYYAPTIGEHIPFEEVDAFLG